MPEQDWEREFDDIYLPAYLELHETIADYLNNQLKAFIRSTLAEQRKLIVEKILEEIPDNYRWMNEFGWTDKQQLKAKWLNKFDK